MSAGPDPLTSVLDWHLAHYPLIRAADIYKLVHQSVFGPGHIITDPAAARAALAAELAAVRRRCCLQSVEPEEPLDPAGRLIRVNLEPLRAVADAADRLLPVLLATAAEVTGDAGLMSSRLAEALAWSREKLAEQVEPLAALIIESAAGGWPARHHSAVYATAYRPAYRVVSAARWPGVAPVTGDCAGPPGSPPPVGTSG
jgi:hypothetical protein